jgi:acetyl esterase/lipase
VNFVAPYRKLVAVSLITLSWLGVIVATSAAPAAGAARHVPTGDAFYVPPRPLATAKPGTIIRRTPIQGAPAGARAWKILYHSRTVNGKDIAVSGVVIAPTDAAPRGGRVVVTWAHGTTGLADICAPSKQPDIASAIPPAQSNIPPAERPDPVPFYWTGTLIPMLQTFLDAGYVVAATDYEGLGTPGLHPYSVGESEGRSVLDAARAARGVKAAAATRKALVLGLSQGGQAALFAGELAASYAPDLRVLGVAAEAPAAVDIEHTLPLLGASNAENGSVVEIIEGFHAAYPQFDAAAVLTPDALAQASVVDQKCDGDVQTTFSSSPRLVLAHNPLDIPAMATLLHSNSAGNRPAGAPLLVAQGSADFLVPQTSTDGFVTKACAAGESVDYRVYPGATHVGVLDAASTDVAAWFADRVIGAPAASTCS